MFSQLVHRYIYLFGLFSLAFGMMVGTVPTSVPQLILAGNWVIEGRFRLKWDRLRRNHLFWLLISVYLVHVAGLFYSNDLDAALHDIRTKLPLIFLPLVFLSALDPDERLLQQVFGFFIAGCVANTLWCLVYSFALHDVEVVRNASRFMSHIRLGLYLNLAIAGCIYYARRGSGAKRIMYWLLPFYFIFSMVALGLASGLANFILLILFFCVVKVFRAPWRTRIAAGACLVLIAIVVLLYVDHVRDGQLQVKNSLVNRPQRVTPGGNSYFHFDTAGQKENGYYVLMNIQPDELRRAWNSDFPADTFSYHPGHNLQRYEVLLRYLSSKGLMKDSLGYAQLNDGDKNYVRNGFTNFRQPGWNFLQRRVYELVNEYDESLNGRGVNGHSFTMRLYFWNATFHAIRRNYLFGSGTGDVQAELDRSYRETASPLSQEWRKRPHNQFLTVTLGLGIFGLLVFLTGIFLPVLLLRKTLHPLYWPFLVLAVVSFLFEDTLETQAGLTFYAFFNTFFLCEAWFRKQRTPAGSQVSH